MTDEKEMFETIKVAKVKIAPVLPQKVTTVAKKEDFIQSVPVVNHAAVSVAKVESTPSNKGVTKPIELALTNAAKNVLKKQVIKVTTNTVKFRGEVQKQKIPVVAKTNRSYAVSKKGIYAVQLASFANLSNAEALVNKLRSQGFTANYIKTSSRRGVMYKVFTGHSPVKSDVMKIRAQLATAMQLNGVVVNTGVS
jgi:DedD protein